MTSWPKLNHGVDVTRDDDELPRGLVLLGLAGAVVELLLGVGLGAGVATGRLGGGLVEFACSVGGGLLVAAFIALPVILIAWAATRGE